MTPRILNWSFAVARGIVAVIFGIIAFLWPQITLRVLFILLGLYILLDAVLTLFIGLRHRRVWEKWWLPLVQAIVGIGLSLFFILFPGVSVTAVVFIIAAWALITGIIELVYALQNRRDQSATWLLGIGGFLSVVLGILLAIQPEAGAKIILWIIAVYAIIYGVVLLIYGLKARPIQKK